MPSALSIRARASNVCYVTITPGKIEVNKQRSVSHVTGCGVYAVVAPLAISPEGDA